MSIPKISEAEWEIMKVLWRDSPLSANEVINTLGGKTNWNQKTIRTLIGRLVDKNALGVNREGRLYTYYPLVSEEECVKAETKSLLKRLYGGAMKPFLVNFIKDEQLTPQEIEELKHILDEKESTAQKSHIIKGKQG